MDTVFGVAYDGGGTFIYRRGYAVVYEQMKDIFYTKMHPEKLVFANVLLNKRDR